MNVGILGEKYGNAIEKYGIPPVDFDAKTGVVSELGVICGVSSQAVVRSLMV